MLQKLPIVLHLVTTWFINLLIDNFLMSSLNEIVPQKVFTKIIMNNGEEYTFDKQIHPDDIKAIGKIWDTVRTEEIQQLEMAAKYKILTYLKEKGYKHTIVSTYSFP